MSESNILKAMELQSRGHHVQAADLFRKEGNKERPVAEKKALWHAADNTEGKSTCCDT